MEALRKVIDSKLLEGVIPLPDYLKNKKIEIILFPSEEKTERLPLSIDDIDAMLKGSITESLIGVLPHSDKSLEEYRSERVKKHERLD